MQQPLSTMADFTFWLSLISLIQFAGTPGAFRSALTSSCLTSWSWALHCQAVNGSHVPSQSSQRFASILPTAQDCTIADYVTMKPTHSLPRTPNLKRSSLQLIEVCSVTRRRRRRQWMTLDDIGWPWVVIKLSFRRWRLSVMHTPARAEFRFVIRTTLPRSLIWRWIYASLWQNSRYLSSVYWFLSTSYNYDEYEDKWEHEWKWTKRHHSALTIAVKLGLE